MTSDDPRYSDPRWFSRGTMKAAILAAKAGVSMSTTKRWTSVPRAEWLAAQAARREAIRAYHDDGGHPWPATAAHFGIEEDTARQLAYRARKERAQGTLPGLETPEAS